MTISVLGVDVCTISFTRCSVVNMGQDDLCEGCGTLRTQDVKDKPKSAVSFAHRIA